MRVYTYHELPGASALTDEPVFVREGFNWPAALFTVFWALAHGLWLTALAIVAVFVALEAALALLGDAVSAEQAEAWGMIYRAVDDDALMDEARKLCAHFAAQPTRGLAEIKKALHYSLHQGLDAQLDYERDVQRELGRSDDYKEGVAAFFEKRKPRFNQ